MDEVLKFIRHRFSKNCNWTTGNCYYFAVILKARFPEAETYYQPDEGHFLTKIGNKYYDWAGIVKPSEENLINWKNLETENLSYFNRIKKDCVL